MLDLKPMTGRIGAEASGVDLRQSISADLAGELQAALDRHQVLVFRAQHLDIQQQKAFTLAFGPLHRSRYISSGIDGEPDVIRVLKEANEGGGVFGGDWHSDLSFLDAPPGGSVLCAHEIPPYGGDTVWASQTAAWEALPEPLKAFLDGRLSVHVGKPYGVKWAPPAKTRTGASITMVRGDPEADEERFHPAVLTLPRTGKRAIFMNPIYSVRIDGMTEAESKPILDQVQAHVTRPEFCVRLRWGAGDVAVWDNLATQHYAVNDYHGFRRLMYRTAFAAPKPV